MELDHYHKSQRYLNGCHIQQLQLRPAMHLRSTSGTYQMRQNLPAQTVQYIRSAGTFRYVRTSGTLPQTPIVPPESSGTQFVPPGTWFSEPHTKDFVPELVLNLIPRTFPQEINLVPKTCKPPLQKLSRSSGTRLLEPSETRTGTTPTATPKPYVDGKSHCFQGT